MTPFLSEVITLLMLATVVLFLIGLLLAVFGLVFLFVTIYKDLRKGPQ